MSTYFVRVDAYTNAGALLTSERLTVEDIVEGHERERRGHALAKARREFFARTALVSGVRVEVRPMVAACRAVPGTWILVHGKWVQVDRWEPYTGDACRLFTTDPHEPYAGIYARWDTFETR